MLAITSYPGAILQALAIELEYHLTKGSDFREHIEKAGNHLQV